MIFQKIQPSRGVRPFFDQKRHQSRAVHDFRIFLSEPSRAVRLFSGDFFTKKATHHELYKKLQVFWTKKRSTITSCTPIFGRIFALFFAKSSDYSSYFLRLLFLDKNEKKISKLDRAVPRFFADFLSFFGQKTQPPRAVGPISRKTKKTAKKNVHGAVHQNLVFFLFNIFAFFHKIGRTARGG